MKPFLLLSLGLTSALASPVINTPTAKRDIAADVSDDIFTLVSANLLPELFAQATFANGTLPSTTNNANATDLDDAANNLNKRADFCYQVGYYLAQSDVNNWGNAFQNTAGTFWMPATSWASWNWDSANIKVCAVNRYIAVWDGSSVPYWEIGWAMKAISGDCPDSWYHTRGGRITGHGTNGRGIHIYLTDTSASCY
ncbi:hypothetical protein B0H63DRAFT_560687 [Podospora didyma]|uniref:Uncharacterized protein n=1 Tax=Podospora didyma TaxID=330526 RepID=A0AAE0TV42_9PEZI|nr:hypothetical protein B0H63DRAFT_560687 [Podospora didyma]